ncbi:MAG TPA: PhzF family phenazine biosynthesis protein [Usitatibacter sp.]|nr:PhzF family phenazine biosynthesis protein [Usitatibacter sp.]
MARELTFRIVNVFTRGGVLTGNPLCVFEDGAGLETATMLALARQFNLSETTFILPSETATARVRIFTPSYEMPFAGHPTLGTAHVVRELKACGDSLSLETHVGAIPVKASGDRWTLQAKAAKSRAVAMARSDLEPLLGLAPGDIGDWPLWVNAGKEQLVIPLASAGAVRRARPKAEIFSVLQSEDGQGMAYVFHDAGDAAATVEARFFFPSGAAVLEDPATGSACANLGGWYQLIRPGSDVRRTVSQGDAVGRPSTLYLDVTGRAIHVGGDVIELGRGRIAL